MRVHALVLGLCVLFLFVILGCSEKQAEVTVLKAYPIDGTEGVIAKSGVEFDAAVSSDGGGSLRIKADQPTTVRLFETGDIDAENARLTYRARVKTENLQGKAYLEMWCQFEGKGEYFSRDLATPVTGTIDWSSEETPFFLKKGENPDNVKLNLVIDGKGTVWIDDVKLVKGGI